MNRFTPKQYLNIKHKELVFIEEVCLHEINFGSVLLTEFYFYILCQSYNEANFLLYSGKEQVIHTTIEYISKSSTQKEAVDKMYEFYKDNHPLRCALDMQVLYDIRFD